MPTNSGSAFSCAACSSVTSRLRAGQREEPEMTKGVKRYCFRRQKRCDDGQRHPKLRGLRGVRMRGKEQLYKAFFMLHYRSCFYRSY